MDEYKTYFSSSTGSIVPNKYRGPHHHHFHLHHHHSTTPGYASKSIQGPVGQEMESLMMKSTKQQTMEPVCYTRNRSGGNGNWGSTNSRGEDHDDVDFEAEEFIQLGHKKFNRWDSYGVTK